MRDGIQRESVYKVNAHYMFPIWDFCSKPCQLKLAVLFYWLIFGQAVIVNVFAAGEGRDANK